MNHSAGKTISGIVIAGFLLASQASAEKFIPSDAPEQAFEEQDFWDNGKVRQYRRLDSEGRVVGKADYRNDGSLAKLEKFDKRGNKIAEARFDGSGKLDDSLDGWAARRWIYKDGKLAFESYYGEDDRIKERVFYDEYGNIMARQFIGDNNLDPNEEFSSYVTNGQIIQYLREDGNTVESETMSWR
jgi:antitoxin component YwqK of YwqJK toxin-antitoxin module